jgi:hypothetical protein
MSVAAWQQSLRDLIAAFEPGSDAIIEGFMEADRILCDGYQENFYNQVDETGSAWLPRKDSLPHPLLIKTGIMFKAATDPTAPGHLTDIQGDTLISGISGEFGPYAVFHHLGTRLMPSRRVIYASDQTLSRIEEAFADAIERNL